VAILRYRLRNTSPRPLHAALAFSVLTRTFGTVPG